MTNEPMTASNVHLWRHTVTDRTLITAYLKALRDERHGARKGAVSSLGEELRARGYSLSPSDLKARL